MTSNSNRNGDGTPLLSPSDNWDADFRPLTDHHHHPGDRGGSRDDEHSSGSATATEGIVLASISLASLFSRDKDALLAFAPPPPRSNDDDEAGRGCGASTALADYAARTLCDMLPIASSSSSDDENGGGRWKIRTMGQASRAGPSSDDAPHERRRRRRRRRMDGRGGGDAPVPFVLERTDCAVVRDDDDGRSSARLQLLLHATTVGASPDTNEKNELLKRELGGLVGPVLDRLADRLTSAECRAHAACVVLQRKLRAMLQPPKGSRAAGANNECLVGNNGEEKKSDGGGAMMYLDAVAFVADGSMLPRRSGRSALPMPSPPAVPFASPESDQLTRVVTVEVGEFWRRYLREDGSVVDDVGDPDIVAAGRSRGGGRGDDDAMMGTSVGSSSSPPLTTVTMRGMIVPRGVTLIVGGGYHGKSTLLQAINMGVYDAVPGDGRERAVTHADAVSVRAEDGRYVHDANVSAFISDLPGGSGSGRTMSNGDDDDEEGGAPSSSFSGASSSTSRRQDTMRFSTRDASGSTSQAANVVEALESGASALLVDEDVSAANFMARDGRMRAMIMDEPITPLLYRVNGLFLSPRHGTSTVVVVGGVGEWLDVADAVVLMRDYVAYDGLAKARSVSYQFSYGHVQYAGRGVVHRLPWEVKKEGKGGAALAKNGGEDDARPKTLSPLRRRPDPDCLAKKFRNAAVHLPESGSSRLWFYRDDDDDEDDRDEDNDDEDDGVADMSKCSQLLAGNAAGQLYGCAVCILWLLGESTQRPGEDLCDLLDEMERALDKGGMNGLLLSSSSSSRRCDRTVAVDDAATTGKGDGRSKNFLPLLSELLLSRDALDLWEAAGHACRPRRHEVAMALTRMRGMRFDILPEKPRAVEGEDDDNAMISEEEARRLEEESKKRALAELWANRRKK